MTVFTSAQYLHDRAEPNADPDFLDTVAGDNWLVDAADRLIEGIDLKIGAKTLVDHAALEARLSEHLAERLPKVDADEHYLARLLIRIVAYSRDSELRSLAGHLLGVPNKITHSSYTIVHELAEELIKVHAPAQAEFLNDEALEYALEDAREAGLLPEPAI